MSEAGERKSAEELAPALAFGSVAWLLAGLACGGALGLLVLPGWLPGLDASLRGEPAHAPWYVCRASGVVAYLLLWASACTGLVISARVARDLEMTPAVLDLHQHLALTALAFALLHAGVLLADAYLGFGALELVFPFSTRRFKPVAVGFGQVALYAALAATAAFYLRRDLGRPAWRALHLAGAGAFGLALLHGLQAGSDGASPGLRLAYWVTGGSVLLLGFYRVLSGRVRDARP